MTEEERKREQKPWYPTLERMPEIRDVENWQNRSISGKPVSLEEDAEAEEKEPVTDDLRVREAGESTAPVNPAKE